MSKDSCRFHTGNTQWSMWVCLLTWDCLSHYSFHDMAYKKMFNLVKLGVELKMNWLNGSIPISSGFQFQFKISQFKSNSIHAELNWIDYQFQFNSWIDPSPVRHNHNWSNCINKIHTSFSITVAIPDSRVSPWRRLCLGCGDIWQSVVSQPWI